MQTPDSKYLDRDQQRPRAAVVLDRRHRELDRSRARCSSTTPGMASAWHPDGTRLYSAGARPEQRAGVQLRRTAPSRARERLRCRRSPARASRGGLDHHARRHDAVRRPACSRRPCPSIDLASGQVTKTVPLPAEPYTSVVFGRRTACCSSRSGAARASQVYMLPSMIAARGVRHRRASQRDGAVAATASACSSPAATARIGLGVRHLLGRSARDRSR